jgi:DNA mismatch endonuclease, patch repair protein
MTDTVDYATRSRMMAGIHGANTRPERLLRSGLHRAGYRFVLHSARLPGRPDIVLPKFRTAILVHGCFWHAHGGCRYYRVPATREVFWRKKFASNVARDARNVAELRGDGWRVLVVWECALRWDPAKAVLLAVNFIRSRRPTAEIGMPLDYSKPSTPSPLRRSSK